MAVTVYFATNRRNAGTESKPKFTGEFHEKGPHYLRFGSAEVEAPAGGMGKYTVNSVELAPESIPTGPGRKSAPKLGSRAVFDELRDIMKTEERDVIVLIHGFAATFEDALERAAQVKTLYGGDLRPLEVFVFSWPADGTMVPYLSYHSDRADAKTSGVAMARALLKLIEWFGVTGPRRFCWQSIHLVAHSMGNYALRHALQGVIAELGRDRLPRVFQNVFLMAADEDADAFEHEHKFARLASLADAVHVYYAADDGALKISATTKNNEERLGATGPRLLSGLPQKVTLVDCRRVNDTTLAEQGHQYYRNRPEVVADVRQVLQGKLPDEVSDRDYVPDKRAFRIRPA